MALVTGMNDRLGKVKLYELNEAYGEVLSWFFSYPNQPMSLSELASQVSISKSTANRVVKRLEKEGFLNKETLGRVWRITCNTDHVYNYSRKIAHNLNMVYESGIISRIIKKFPGAKAIILFGSYRKGDDTQKSDIDIAVEIIGSESVQVINMSFFPEFGHRKNVPVNITLFSRKKIDLNLFTNIANGIVLDGFLEVRP